MLIPEVIYSATANKCPRCHTGKIFSSPNPYSRDALKMEKTCSHCGEKYEKETGFFYGAMYVSYALMAGWFIVWLALQYLWLDWNIDLLLGVIAGSILIFAPVTFRIARIIWLNFFVRYHKEYKTLGKKARISLQ